MKNLFQNVNEDSEIFICSLKIILSHCSEFCRIILNTISLNDIESNQSLKTNALRNKYFSILIFYIYKKCNLTKLDNPIL